MKQVQRTTYLDEQGRFATCVIPLRCAEAANAGWTKIQTHVFDFMNDMQASQIFTERIHQFAHHYAQVKEEHLHDEDIAWWPGTADLLLLQGTSYRTRLAAGSMEEADIDLPLLKADILRDVSRWLVEKKDELEVMIRELRDGIFPKDAQAVELACCVLQCYGCYCFVRFPEALVHGCFRGYNLLGRNWAIHNELRQRDDLFDRTVIETLGYCPWSVGEGTARHMRRRTKVGYAKRTFTVIHFDAAREAIRMCGKDPLRTTWKEMDKSNPIFSQRTPNMGETVMTWRRAVSVFFSVQHLCLILRLRSWSPSWVKVGGKSTTPTCLRALGLRRRRRIVSGSKTFANNRSSAALDARIPSWPV